MRAQDNLLTGEDSFFSIKARVLTHTPTFGPGIWSLALQWNALRSSTEHRCLGLRPGRLADLVWNAGPDPRLLSADPAPM